MRTWSALLLAALLAFSSLMVWSFISGKGKHFIDFEPETSLVIIDQSHAAYTVFIGIPKEISQQELQEIQSKVSKKEREVMMTWTEFIRYVDKHAKATIVKYDYPDYWVVDGIVCLVGKVPGTPWGLTWNGGIALTSNDYRHAEETYDLFQEDPEKYELTVFPGQPGDPVNPGGHLPAFGCL